MMNRYKQPWIRNKQPHVYQQKKEQMYRIMVDWFSIWTIVVKEGIKRTVMQKYKSMDPLQILWANFVSIKKKWGSPSRMKDLWSVEIVLSTVEKKILLEWNCANSRNVKILLERNWHNSKKDPRWRATWYDNTIKKWHQKPWSYKCKYCRQL
jgi:hypothetical protein